MQWLCLLFGVVRVSRFEVAGLIVHTRLSCRYMICSGDPGPDLARKAVSEKERATTHLTW